MTLRPVSPIFASCISSHKLVPSRVGDLVLAERSLDAASGATSVRVKPARRFARRLRTKSFRARIEIKAIDQYGNRSSASKRVRVKKAARKRKRR